MVRFSVEMMLHGLGFEVLTAVDGEEGVATFRRHLDAIRLVLLDVKMPRMGGEEALAEMRRIRSDVRVVLMTGYGEEEIFQGAKPSGFLFKPFRVTDLKDKVREILSGPAPTY